MSEEAKDDSSAVVMILVALLASSSRINSKYLVVGFVEELYWVESVYRIVNRRSLGKVVTSRPIQPFLRTVCMHHERLEIIIQGRRPLVQRLYFHAMREYKTGMTPISKERVASM